MTNTIMGFVMVFMSSMVQSGWDCEVLSVRTYTALVECKNEDVIVKQLLDVRKEYNTPATIKIRGQNV